jgi:hypothetical protein
MCQYCTARSSIFFAASRLMLAAFLCAPFSGAFAQSVSAGKALYTATIVSGKKSCSDAQCHTVDPTRRQNKIQNGAVASVISSAIASVTEMRFLAGRLTNQNLTDLAAYIANPTAGAGSPTAQVSPSTLSFGASSVGTATVAQTLTVNNTGTAALVLSGITTGSTEFAVSGGTCTATTSIAAAGSCTISLQFTPSVAGARSATLTISHNAVGGSSAVSLSGSGTAIIVPTPAQAELSVSSLSFASTVVGASSTAQNVTLTNRGGVPLTMGAVISSDSDFSITLSTCGMAAVVAPGASCRVAVVFAPTAVGARAGQLTFNHSASPSSNTVSLAGTGAAAPVPNITKVMTEYRYAPLAYYFITSRDSDKAILDVTAGFERTGQSFAVFATQQPNTRGITRYYFDRVALAGERGSHFYTLVDTEKSALQSLNPTNAPAPKLPVDEGVDSFAYLPLVEGVGGSCAAGQTSVYRIFRGNARFPDDPNHRFTTHVTLYNELVAQGWDGEGVKFCVPK